MPPGPDLNPIPQRNQTPAEKLEAERTRTDARIDDDGTNMSEKTRFGAKHMWNSNGIVR